MERTSFSNASSSIQAILRFRTTSISVGLQQTVTPVEYTVARPARASAVAVCTTRARVPKSSALHSRPTRIVASKPDFRPKVDGQPHLTAFRWAKPLPPNFVVCLSSYPMVDSLAQSTTWSSIQTSGFARICSLPTLLLN